VKLYGYVGSPYVVRPLLLARWWQTVQADPVAAALRSGFHGNFRAFLAARMKAA
jgi:hypothetical protein